jgi:hypothetical protein
MASSDVDQKYLGRFARQMNNDNPYLSSMLFKILGLSIILSKKLLRARRLRKLDTTRDTKSLQLYHHIIWLSREGLVMVEQYVLPMVANYQNDLKVLSYKLRASFHHIFVLFHNYPPATQTAIPALARPPRSADGGSSHNHPTSPGMPPAASRSPSQLMNGGPVGGIPAGGASGGGANLPPGLGTAPLPKPTSTFLLPAINYIPIATAAFEEASAMADRLLAGSHPMRLSVKLEYAAFIYDCLKDGEASRKLAKHAIADVYNASEAMDDDAFEDAAYLVKILGRMMKRGVGVGLTPGSTPGGASSSPSVPRSTPNVGTGPLPPGASSPGLTNFI